MDFGLFLLFILTVILLSGLRLGFLTSFVALVEAASLASAYLAWGNWSSVTSPSKMNFYRFAPATNVKQNLTSKNESATERRLLS